MKPWETDSDFLARWLNNELSAEELSAFETSEDFAAYQRLVTVSDALESPAYDVEKELQKLESRIEQAKTPQLAKEEDGKVISMYPSWKVGVAAAIAFAVGFGSIYLLFGNSGEFQMTAQTIEQVILPDSSVVTVQPGSSIAYNKSEWDESREVQLDGEAFFEVQKGEKFDVVLDNGTVSVLGTSFNIKEEENAIDVVCYTGKVKVEAYNQSEILTPGQGVLASKDAEPVKNTTNLSQPVWVNQSVIMKETTLREAIRMLEEIYDVKVKGQPEVTTSATIDFPSDDIEIALEQIFPPFGLKYTWDPEQRIVLIE